MGSFAQGTRSLLGGASPRWRGAAGSAWRSPPTALRPWNSRRSWAVRGSCKRVAPDGSGGWYIGGLFTHVGGVARNNIAHLSADQTLAPSFDPDSSGGSFALVREGYDDSTCVPFRPIGVMTVATGGRDGCGTPKGVL